MADPISITGSAVGVISFGLTVFSGLLQYYGDWKDSERDIAATYTSIEGLTKTFMLIKDTLEGQSFRRDIVDRVLESLNSCSTGVQSLEKKLAKIRSATPEKPGEKLRVHARKAAYPFKKSTLIKLAEIVSDLRDNLSLAVDTLQLDVSTSSLRKLEDISTRLAILVQRSQSASADVIKGIAEVRLTQKEYDIRLLDQERIDIIGWLSPLNFNIRQNDVRSRWQQGAGKWLLQSDQFQTWLDGRINILWCPGMPGAGKTVLVSVVVDYLKQWTQPDGVALASLFQQVVQQQTVLSEDVKSLFKHHSRERTRPSLPEYIMLLQAHIQRFSRVFIVVDALDECSENDGVRDSFLAQLRYLLPNIRLLVTSRDIASLGYAFEDATRLEIRANEDDLRTYLQVRLEEQALLTSHIKDEPRLKDTIVNTIIDKANGMFLLAELHLNSLLNHDNRRHLRRALQSLPEDINKTYDETMLRIESQDRQKVERAGQVLSWISLAEQPITVRELQCALALEPEDTEFDEEAVPKESALLSVCCGLVVVEQESSILRFVHLTTEKYFEQTRQTRYPSAQKALSEACLTYLSLNVFASGPCPEENIDIMFDSVRGRLQVNPLLKYAARHWGNHARKAFEQGFSIDNLILEFLKARGSVGSSVQAADLLDPLRCFFSPAILYTNISGLHIAAGFGLNKLARQLIDQGTDINVRDYLYWTPLHRAAAKGHDATVRLLLDRGADTRAKDPCNSTALDLAAAAGHEAVVQSLLEVETEVRTAFGGISPSHGFGAAAESGHVKIVQMLVERLKPNEHRGNIMGKLLHRAVLAGQERVVRLLQEEGEGLEGFDLYTSQALGLAAYRNNTSMMGLLLNKGANSEAVNDYGDKPLHQTAEIGHHKIISLLLDTGANLECVAENGETAVIEAANSGSVHAVEHGHESVLEAFLENGAEIDGKAENLTTVPNAGRTKSDYSQTALMLAAHVGRTSVVKLLLENGANIKAKNDKSETALILAASNGHTPVVELLLENRADAGANVNARDLRYTNETSLHRAVVHFGSDEVVKMLIESGADLEAQDRFGVTALVKAVQKGQVAISQLLLERGADPNHVGATVTPSRKIYEVDSQTALKLVQEAQKTWKGKETGSDPVKDH